MLGSTTHAIEDIDCMEQDQIDIVYLMGYGVERNPPVEVHTTSTNMLGIPG